MTGKEIVKRVISYNDAPRIGYGFNPEYGPSDLYMCNLAVPEGMDVSWHEASEYADRYEILKHFNGTVRHDEYGNLWGRMRQDTTGKGEALWGALEDWEDLDDYKLPPLDDPALAEHLRQTVKDHPDKYMIGILPGFPFSIMRNLRKFDEFLMDVILEPELVAELGARVTDQLCRIIENYADVGMDAVMVYEDWGIQDRLLISPACWREIFFPFFKQLASKAHECGLSLILHSCGYIYDVLEDMIHSGVDVFQFDQPTLMGEERVAALLKQYRRTLFSPVDIQKVLPGGDKKEIEEEAERMIRLFADGGGLIAGDYMDYPTIQVKEEWAGWARAVFMEKGWNGNEKD